MAKIVEQAPMPPGQCLFSQDIEGPWIDTEVVAPWVGPYGYVSVRYWEQVARDCLGMVPGEEVEELRRAAAAMADEITQLREIVDTQNKLDELLEGAGI